jgi:hypothetical protein
VVDGDAVVGVDLGLTAFAVDWAYPVSVDR